MTDIDLDAIRTDLDTYRWMSDAGRTSVANWQANELVKRIPALLAEVDRLRAIADAAEYKFGAQPCMEGECEHAAEIDENADENGPCPLVETRHATADDVIERDELRAEVDRLRGENARLRGRIPRSTALRYPLRSTR